MLLCRWCNQSSSIDDSTTNRLPGLSRDKDQRARVLRLRGYCLSSQLSTVLLNDWDSFVRSYLPRGANRLAAAAAAAPLSAPRSPPPLLLSLRKEVRNFDEDDYSIVTAALIVAIRRTQSLECTNSTNFCKRCQHWVDVRGACSKTGFALSTQRDSSSNINPNGILHNLVYTPKTDGAYNDRSSDL